MKSQRDDYRANLTKIATNQYMALYSAHLRYITASTSYQAELASSVVSQILYDLGEISKYEYSTNFLRLQQSSLEMISATVDMINTVSTIKLMIDGIIIE